MNVTQSLQRPLTLRDVAKSSGTLEDFGRNLRDWQHVIQRGGVHSHKAFQRSIADPPPALADRFEGGDTADAMLAAYAEWLADQAGIPRPEWCGDPLRISREPWFGSPLRGWLIAHAPASFRQRNVFTIPEAVFTPKPGRPTVSREQKMRKAAVRQRAYRRRIRTLVEKARRMESDPPPASSEE
ncbi:MAG: hypothetical protein JJU29_18135 [Verrucomicrobia bacterium]|nr:hypothetical protein [Verrucomicrobiota bacterium]MCH8514399.1 hypothetical protein [Kiritimatiellia bacterium]